LVLAAAIQLSGCLTGSVVQQSARAHCREDRVQSLVGKAASVGLAEEAQRLSGAREIQWNPSGAIVTTAYRFGRLSVDLDQENRVARISCG
jgi:hypothetical protein